MSMIKPFSYSMAAVLLSSTSALAAACFDDSSTSCATSNASDCLALGYSKDDVVGCKHYLLCPFDTSYKACVTQKFMDCSDYPLTKCPDNGFCSECNDGSTTKYKLDRCDNCFSQISVNGGMCSRNYQYDKCPTDAGAAACSECTYSGKTVYNILTCKPGYTLNGVTSNSRTCVAKTCPSGYSTAYQSVADCGSTGSNGWTFTSSGYSGDKICGKCTAKTCASYGYMDKQLDDFLCKVSASVYKGNTQSTCYDCVSCRYAGIPLGTSYAYIGYAVCGTVCSNVKTSSKVVVGANLRTFSKDGRTGFCYAWQQSVDRAKKFCCCKNGSYTGDSVSGCK